MKKPSAISLFSGAMGLDLGIERAGFDIRVCLDNDPLAVATIKLNTKMPVIEEDVNKVSSVDILKAAKLGRGKVDLVFGGPPCQAFSTAGARRSLQDFRGNVIVNFLRIVDEVSPKAFLLENVRGLLSSRLDYAPEGYEEYRPLAAEPGSVVYFLVREFEKLGYSVSFALFDSANYGVPQRRERVLMFGAKGKRPIALPHPTHTADGALTGKKWAPFKDAVKGLRERKMRFLELRDAHKKYLAKLGPGQCWRDLPAKDQKEAMGKSYYLQGGKTGFYRRLAWHKPSPALVTSPIMPATMLCHPEKLRPLSIEEYARIQQFPDGWDFAGGIRGIYKQIGNAVPVGLGEAAGQAIAAFLAGKQQEVSQLASGLQYSRYRGTDHQAFLAGFTARTAQAGLGF